ncbi:ATP-dependent helicase [Maribellus sp. YY47]|uniref:ATP-dependent helicase n=1 Tax=Maribellus sp. YY47 TaxID=2929486 RepID=UPI002001BBAF|nr:ATP-dependent helicase [Maribellus sp. YY47]MCK3684375.1 ATP-dependent helicase [Maribellus sp. YY47]
MNTNSEFRNLISLAGSAKFNRSGSDPYSFSCETGQEASIEALPNDDLKCRIEELQAIARSIDSKIVSHKIDDPTKYKIDYQAELNSQQLSAVLEIDNPLLVIAGAGTGKTRVITYKVSYLIEKGYLPEEILLLTFTKKASKEMLNRVNVLLKGTNPGNVFGGTFHSFANYVLRKYHHFVGLSPNFSIIDAKDAEDIVDLVKTELKISGNGRKAFPSKDTVYDIISKSHNQEKPVDEIIFQYYNTQVEFTLQIVKIEEGFNQYKKAANLLDYDDLIDRLRIGLRDNAEFRQLLQKKFKYILVDEYQDTNIAQNEIVELLTGDRNCVTVVGDDMQSIYGFRGANFENILRFPSRYESCKVIKIEQNYRSNKQILDFTNRIVESAVLGFKKTLFSDRNSPHKPLIKKLYDTEQEAEFIADRIFRLKEEGIPYSEMAVLVRASWHSNIIQIELNKRGIPFVMVGGIKFVEKRHIKDVLAFLKISFNVYDAVSWQRVLKLIPGIGKVTAGQIIQEIHRKKGSIDFSGFSGKKYYKILKQLSGLINSCQQKQDDSASAIDSILDYYKPVLMALVDDYEIRYNDLDILTSLAGKYKSVEQFVSDFTLEPPSDKFQSSLRPQDDDEKPMTISTIHSAKGLEWHSVFIPFALDGLMPSVKALDSIEELEEERRLFYVACSRPKENLVITMPSYMASRDAFFTIPSRFIDQIQ